MACVTCAVEKPVDFLWMCCGNLCGCLVPLAPVSRGRMFTINDLRVNYLFQICAFYEWLERNPLSANAIALWHALMYLWNHSFWAETFTPAVTSIIPRCNLSKSSILRAREELCENGLLTVTPRKKKQTSIYELKLFIPHPDTQYKQKEIKQNETKYDITTSAPVAIDEVRREELDWQEKLNLARERLMNAWNQ